MMSPLELQQAIAELETAKRKGLVRTAPKYSIRELQRRARNARYRNLILSGRCGWCEKKNDRKASLCSECARKDSESKKKRKNTQ